MQWEDSNSPSGSVKNLERIKKGREAQLKKLLDESKKDNVLIFEKLGVDYLFVDEADAYYSAGDEGGKEYLILNCAYVFAAERFRKLCAIRREIFTENLAEHVAAIHKSFFLPESGLYCISTEHKDLCSQLGNAFAVLIGLGDERT